MVLMIVQCVCVYICNGDPQFRLLTREHFAKVDIMNLYRTYFFDQCSRPETYEST